VGDRFEDCVGSSVTEKDVPRLSRPLAGGLEVLVALAVTAAVFVPVAAGWLAPLERPSFDLLVRLPRPVSPPEPPVAAVVIDDASVAALGPLPWPRARLAAVVTASRREGARAVAIDLLLAEPTRSVDDRALAAAIADLPHVIAAALDRDGSWVMPTAELGGPANAAHVHAEIASDGVVRGFSSTKQAHGLALPAMALAVARLAGAEVRVEPGRLIRPGWRFAPTQVEQVRAADLLAGSADVTGLRDRVVLLGVTASGAGDQFLVPVGDRHRPVPGVLVHAAAAAAVLDGDLLRSAPVWLVLVLLFVEAVSVQVLRTLAGRLRPFHPVVAMAGGVGVAVLLLWSSHLVVPVVAVVTAALVSTLAREVIESRLAQAEAGQLLHELVAGGGGSSVALPRGARGRLRLVRELQNQVARDRDLRQTLLDGLGEGVMLWDRDGRVVLANTVVAALWAEPPQRAWMERATGNDVGSLPSAWELRHRGRHLAVETRELAHGSLVIVRDVTAERELARQREEMQRLVSHELKTPLASLAGFGGMLERYEMNPTELKRVAGLIRGEAERLGAMVAGFLDLQSLGEGIGDEDRVAVDLGELVRTRCSVLRAAAGDRGQELADEVESGIVVDGVPRLLALVVDNLVGNALKHTPEGSRVEVRVWGDASGAHVAVGDDGPGMDEEVLPRVFDRFYRAPGRPSAGSGLGLAIVREVAEWHGACVHVESTLGEGSVFRVDFPPGRTEREAVEDASESPDRR
jgi:signal transduction histidine kinase